MNISRTITLIAMTMTTLSIGSKPKIVSVTPNYIPKNSYIINEGNYFDGLAENRLTQPLAKFYKEKAKIKKIVDEQCAEIDENGDCRMRRTHYSTTAKKGYLEITKILRDSLKDAQFRLFELNGEIVKKNSDVKKLLKIKEGKVVSINCDEYKSVLRIITK